MLIRCGTKGNVIGWSNIHSCLVYTGMITSLTSGIYKIHNPCLMCQIMVECTRHITCCAVARSNRVPLQAKEHGAVYVFNLRPWIQVSFIRNSFIRNWYDNFNGDNFKKLWCCLSSIKKCLKVKSMDIAANMSLTTIELGQFLSNIN